MIKPDKHEDKPFGLPERTLDDMCRFLKGWPEIERIVIFGSRAMGNYRHNSDVDICLWGKDIDYELLGRIKGGLDDLPTAYKFDVLHYDHITHPPLQNHINEHGVDFRDAVKVGDD